jgi:hypothetical protein
MNYFYSIYAYLGFLVSFSWWVHWPKWKISQAQKYRNNRYFLPVSILFFKTLVSIVSSIWYRYRPIPNWAQEWIFIFCKGGVEKFIVGCMWQNRWCEFLPWIRPCLSLSGVHSDDASASSGPALFYNRPWFCNPLVLHQVICMRESRLFQLLFPLAIVWFRIQLLYILYDKHGIPEALQQLHVYKTVWNLKLQICMLCALAVKCF